jgi:hypothetical protein
MISAYEHGQNAARHGKHIQACPFDPGTAQWREWRDGFLVTCGAIVVYAATLAPPKGRPSISCLMR